MAKVESSKDLNLYAWFEYTISESSTAYTITIQRAGLGSVAWGFTMQYVDAVLSATGMADRAVYSQSFYSAEGASVEAVYLTNQVYTVPKTTTQREFAFSFAVSSEPGHYLGVYYPNRIYHWANLALTLNALASYTITYNANSGTGAPGNGTKWYGQNYAISNTIPTRSGYTFLGWNTSSSATSPNTAYNPGSMYSTNANLTLYAVWKIDYVAPVLSDVTMFRCTSTGTQSSTGNFVKASMSFLAPFSRYLTFTFYKKRSDASTETQILKKTVRYYGERSWNTSYYNTYGAIGYTGTFNQTTGYETAVSVGDYLLLNVHNTQNNLEYQILVEATTSATTSTAPTGKVIARTENGLSSIPVIMSGSLSFILGNNDISADFRHDISMTVTDGTSTASLTYIIPSKYKPLDIGNGGKSFGFGKAASDTESRIDFGIELYDINEKNIKGDALSPMVTSPSSTNQVNHDGRLHYFNISGGSTTNKPGFSTASILHCSSSSSVAQDSQLAISNGFTPVQISARTQDSAGAWNNWVHIVTSSDEASIIAHSTSGIWEYWKFANKLAICLGEYDFNGNLTFNGQYGYSYWPGTSHGWALPFAYATEPKVLATVSSGTQSGIFAISPYKPASNPAGRIEAFIWGPAQATNASLRVYLLAIGQYA